MQTGEILLLATVALVLLGGLVALGVGHRRWSIGTVVAGFLVLLASATYLYFAARVGARDRAWARKIDDYRIRIAKADDDQTLDAKGRLTPPGGGPDSLDRLRERRDRWRRGLDRVETWRGRTWSGASFQPPKEDGATGRVELPAEGNAEDSPPIGVGAHVFLFDTTPFDQGGAYVGDFVVQATAFDQATKRHSLTVVQAASRDDYDRKVLEKPHDDVTVFESLPVDRWLAFYRSPTGAVPAVTGTAAMIDPVKEDAEKVRQLFESSAAVADLVKGFVESFEGHEEEVAEEQWEAAAAEARERPGTLWATVEFTKPHSFKADGAAPEAADAGGPKQDYEPGDEAEFDLQTALDLRDGPGVCTITKVRRRRPLTDALSLLHGTTSPVGEIGVEGTAALRRMLQAQITALEEANARLATSQQAAAANTKDDLAVAAQLEKDLESWRRDSGEAAKLVTGFDRELDRVRTRLQQSEAAIVERGRELARLMARLADEIDRKAPPADRRAARP